MVATRSDVGHTIDPLAVQALETRILGTVIRPGDDVYDQARSVQNLFYDKKPELIVQAADAGDVVRAIEFARARNLPLAVRSGGHSLAGHSSSDGGVVLDLSKMNALRLDPERKTAWIQPGATSADLYQAVEPFGLGLSTGDTSSVGIGGLTTGGGIGWLVRKHGLTIDNLLSAEVVTADGRIVIASAEHHPDLFWAVRGGGGNFGIVTGFEFQLHDVGTILGGMLLLPPTADVLRGYAAYTPTAPDELTTIAFVMTLPPLPFLPEELHGKLVFALCVAYTGDMEAGEEAIAPLRQLAAPLLDLIGPMPYSGMFSFTEMAAVPHAGTVRSGYMTELSDDAIATLLDHAIMRPSPAGMIQLRGLGGAMAKVPADATAFAYRDKPLFLAIINMSPEKEDQLWTTDLWAKMRPYTSGVYVNFLENEGEERIHEAYPADTYARLATVKRLYDPTNLFNQNQNIKPAGS